MYVGLFYLPLLKVSGNCHEELHKLAYDNGALLHRLDSVVDDVDAVL